MVSFKKQKIGHYGLGLGLRKDIRSSTLDFFKSKENKNLIQWFEVVPENLIAKGGKRREELLEVLDLDVQLIPHGINLSIGTASKDGKPSYDPYLINCLKELFSEIKPPWFSDHLSCTRIDNVYLQNLIPIPFNKEAIEVVSTNVKFLQDEFQIPFLIENPSYYSTIFEPEMPEVEFFNRLMVEADCGMLLDVNNIYVNSTNHEAYKPEEYIDQIDLDRVVQVHVAGHLANFTASSGKSVKVLDTHGEAVCQRVYRILDYLLGKTDVNAILLERDFNFPDFEETVAELKTIREIIDKSTKSKEEVLINA